jgi:hypothetical protein
METFLRCFVHSCPAQWIHWIALAEFWYNTSFHSALGRSPFEALYGYSPRTLGVDLSACHNTDLKSWLQDKALMKDLVHQHLVRARLRMKHQADKNRAERQFEVGTWVYVKLQPYVQSSLAHRANQKLAFKFFGPFQIISKIGAVAYKLDLPASSSVHPVFHVSQLKIAVPVTEVPSPTFPSADVQFQVPELILQKRLLARGHATVEQVLIKWSGMTKELATWEDLQALKQAFPLAPAWGQAGCLGGGDVSSAATSEDGPSGPRKSRRERRPNVRCAGPEWV